MAWFEVVIKRRYITGHTDCLAQETPQSVKFDRTRLASLTPQSAVWYHPNVYCSLRYPEQGPRSCRPGST